MSYNSSTWGHSWLNPMNDCGITLPGASRFSMMFAWNSGVSTGYGLLGTLEPTLLFPVLATFPVAALGTGEVAALGTGDVAALGTGDATALGTGDVTASGTGGIAALGTGELTALGGNEPVSAAFAGVGAASPTLGVGSVMPPPLPERSIVTPPASLSTQLKGFTATGLSDPLPCSTLTTTLGGSGLFGGALAGFGDLGGALVAGLGGVPNWLPV